MNRYESDYCSYQVPSEWEPEPPFGFSEPGGAEGRKMVQLLEVWLASPRSAEEYAAQQKEALPHLLQEFELVDEGPYQVEGARDGRYLRYRYISDDGDTTIETRIIEMPIGTPTSTSNSQAAAIIDRIIPRSPCRRDRGGGPPRLSGERCGAR